MAGVDDLNLGIEEVETPLGNVSDTQVPVAAVARPDLDPTTVKTEMIDPPDDDDDEKKPEGDADAAKPEAPANEESDDKDEAKPDGDDDPADEAEADDQIVLSPDVLWAAGKAGISQEMLTRLGTDEAVNAAIEMRAEVQQALQDNAARREEPEAEAPPEIPAPVAWDAALPEGQRDTMDEEVVKALDERDKEAKAKYDAFQAHQKTLETSAPAANDGKANEYSAVELRFDMTVNDLVKEHPEYADALGTGYRDELSDAAFTGRSSIAKVMKELGANHKGTQSELALQAAQIVYRAIDTKTQKKALATRAGKRSAQKVQKPADTKRDEVSPRSKAEQHIADLQRAAGIKSGPDEQGLIDV